jgi:hypothetical protein
MKYTNKFVEFLNGANTIRISGVKDFNSLNSLCKKVGLDMGWTDYYDLLNLAMLNHCAINYSSVLVEYQPYKGFSIGYKTVEDSEKWYEMKPWTMSEVLQSTK